MQRPSLQNTQLALPVQVAHVVKPLQSSAAVQSDV
jgi:hypothetical protein